MTLLDSTVQASRAYAVKFRGVTAARRGRLTLLSPPVPFVAGGSRPLASVVPLPYRKAAISSLLLSRKGDAESFATAATSRPSIANVSAWRAAGVKGAPEGAGGTYESPDDAAPVDEPLAPLLAPTLVHPCANKTRVAMAR